MRTKIKIIALLASFSVFSIYGCVGDGVPGPSGQDGQDATVYYSEWFTPSTWSGTSGDWYFEASAPDLTENIVEGGVILAYVWLAGDLYEGTAIRPLPAYAIGANWSYLIKQYGSIEFTCDMINRPLTSGNSFRFIAIPGTIYALKSASSTNYSKQELENMPYNEVCRLFNIPE
jgi:hypothetical protein